MQLKHINGTTVNVTDAKAQRLLTTSNLFVDPTAKAEDAEETEEDGPTVAELKDQARDLEISGFSTMNKAELIAAVAAAGES